jgi:hypothetical protein
LSLVSVADDRTGHQPYFARSAPVLEMSVVTSGLFALVMLATAGYEWVKADY